MAARAINQNPVLRFLQAADVENARLRDAYPASACKMLADRPARNCSTYGTGARGTIVLWGDSHAEAWAPVFFEIARRRELRVVVFSHGGCPPLLDTRRTGAAGAESGCTSFDTARNTLAAIRALKPLHTFLVGFWSLYADAGDLEMRAAPPDEGEKQLSSAYATKLHHTLAELSAVAPVTIFRTVPKLLNRADRGMLRKLPLEPTVAQHIAFEARANQIIDAAVASLPRLTQYDPAKRLCTEVCHVQLAGTLMYVDENHLSAQGALLFEPDLERELFAADAVHHP